LTYRLAAGLFLLALYLSSAYLREISNFLREKAALALAVNTALVVGGAALIFFYRRHLESLTPARVLGLGLLALGYVGAAWMLPLPEERFHLVQYGLLAWLLTQCLREKMSGGRRHAAAFLLTTAAGIVDEIIQGILPNRVGSLRDVGLNALSAALAQGVLAFLETPGVSSAASAAGKSPPEAPRPPTPSR